MWKQKLCLGINEQFGLSGAEQIKLFQKVGYEAFFVDWSQDAPLKEWAALGKELDLTFQSIHAPFGQISRLWEKDEALASAALDELLACLADCERLEVPIMISHAFIGFEDHTPTEIGLERFYRLIRAAEGSGVRIAFENTEGEEYLEAVMKAFGSHPNVGFCWDSGHEMCYNHSQDMLAKYGQGGNLIATHINDNLGIRAFSGRITWRDDLHLLPFDGIADWDHIAQRLKVCGVPEFLTFELNRESKPGRYDNDLYARMSPELYIAESYKRACRVAAKLL